jgi:hypothetical protein
MRILLIGVLIVGLAGVRTNAVRADEPDAQKLLEKAITAHGGKALTTAKALRYKWTASNGAGDTKVETTSERWVEFPDRVLGAAETTIGQNRRDATSGYDGKVAWIKAGGKVTELDADAAKSLRETVLPDRVMSLVLLQEKNYKLSVVGEAKVGDKPALGVRLERKDDTDVILYFDKESGLMVKAEWRGKDHDGNEVTVERYFTEYKESGQVKYPSRVTVHQDGKPILEMALTEYELLADGFATGHFAKPKE